jgi:CRISPR-associated protein Csc2
MEYHSDDADLLDTIGTYVDDVQRTDWEVYGDINGAEPFPDWFERLRAVTSRSADDADEVLQEELQEVTNEAEDVFVEG